MNSSNALVKTIIFIIIAGITCLIFFGLGSDDKTDMELVSFGFLMFAELVVYLSALIPAMINSKKLSGADVISLAILYAVADVFINYFMIFEEMRHLIIFNVIAILLYLLLLSVVVLTKKK